MTVGASIGIAAFPKHATNGKSLTGLADTAMYRAKKNGELFTVYSPDQPDRRAAL